MEATFTAKNVTFRIEPRTRESLSCPGFFNKGHVLVANEKELLSHRTLTRWNVQDAALDARIDLPLPGTWISIGGTGQWFSIGNGEIATWIKIDT